jgi:hypothetical protein
MTPFRRQRRQAHVRSDPDDPLRHQARDGRVVVAGFRWCGQAPVINRRHRGALLGLGRRQRAACAPRPAGADGPARAVGGHADSGR